jgi:2'-5' RNA ligase
MRGFAPAQDLWRVFVAVDIGDDVRTSLAAETMRLKKVWPKIRWVPIENIHLTLAFLGDVFADRIPDLTRDLDRVTSGLTTCACVVAGLGVFGPERAPRVVWAGVTDGSDQVRALQRSIAEVVEALGLRTEARDFTPHLTLGRVKSAGDARGLVDWLKEDDGKVYGTLHAESVRLMRSEIQPQGSVYSVLHTARLGQ